MSQSCPINFQTYDNTVSRISSFYVALLVAFYLQSGYVAILLFIFFDLVIRVFVDKRYSLVYHMSLLTKKAFSMQTVKKDGASKKLAAYFGLLFTAGMIMFDFLQIQLGVLILATVYVACLLLDTYFDFCLGCKIYYIIKKFYPNFME